jgi:fatty acid desaturase
MTSKTSMTGESPSTHIPWRLNLVVTGLQLVAVMGCCVLAAYITQWWGLVLLSLGFGLLLNSVYSIIHEAEHAMLLPDRKWNDLVGAFMALFFPAPFHLIRQGHLGHHLRNRSDDEAFDFYFEGDHKVWRFLVLYGIVTGLYCNVVFLFLPFTVDKKYWHVDQPSVAFMESLNPGYRRFIQLECAAAIALHIAIVWGLGIPVVNYLVMYAGFGFMWSAMQYVHHYGTERHVTKGARNLWIWAPLDLLWLNHNWHLNHHEHPTIPWIHLPALSESGEAPRGFLPLAYLRMWRGPRRATDRVKNKYTGKIIS